MKTLTRSQWMNQEIQKLVNSNVESVKLLLYPKEMRKLANKIPELRYSGKRNPNRRRSDTRVSYEITKV